MSKIQKPKRFKVLNLRFRDYFEFRNSDLELKSQSGQSLIETIMAIFVLTTGLASGLALAVFSFGAASDISEKIVATGLAREGVEVTRRARDSNWLFGTLENCSDLGAGQQCYTNWLTGPRFFLQGLPGNGRTFRLQFFSNFSGNKWNLQSTAPGADYRLYSQSDGTFNHEVTSAPTNFFRKITIVHEQTSAPYSVTSPLVLVRSSVWWHGKRCAAITDLTNPSQTNCKIISEEYLANWRNY